MFYVEDSIEKMVDYGIKKMPREWCDAGIINTHEKDGNNPDLYNADFLHGIENPVVETSCCRDDIPSAKVPIEDN